MVKYILVVGFAGILSLVATAEAFQGHSTPESEREGAFVPQPCSSVESCNSPVHLKSNSREHVADVVKREVHGNFVKEWIRDRTTSLTWIIPPRQVKNPHEFCNSEGARVPTEQELLVAFHINPESTAKGKNYNLRLAEVFRPFASTFSLLGAARSKASTEEPLPQSKWVVLKYAPEIEHITDVTGTNWGTGKNMSLQALRATDVLAPVACVVVPPSAIP